MARPPSSKSFKVYRLSKPNGKKQWKVEGRPTGKRERFYFLSEKEAKKAALTLTTRSPPPARRTRRAEITKLDWSDIKLDRNIIDLPFGKSKNRRRKLIEVPDNLKNWISPFALTEGSVLPRRNLGRGIERAAKGAEISPWPQNVLRHSFCSDAVALTKGVRVDEHASRPLRANATEALLGGGRPGHGGEVLGHPPLKSLF